MNLGDTIHGAIQAAVNPLPCGGCADRQEALNRVGDWAGDRLRAALSGQRRAILLRVHHGLGDAVVASVVVRHLARRHAVDVVAPRGHASAFWGTARRAYTWDEHPRGVYAETIDLPLDEPGQCYEGHPATKAEFALLAMGIDPDPALCTWRLMPRPIDRRRARDCLARLGAGWPVVLIHYQGHSGRAAKDLSEGTIRAVCRRVSACGAAAVVLDHGHQSEAVERGLAVRLDADDPVWGGRGLDAAVLGALGLEAALCLGIDSGPGHCWSAAGARTIIAWPTAALHPLHYFAPMPGTLHWVSGLHTHALRGGLEPGLTYFLRHYRYRWGSCGEADELPDLIEAALGGELLAEAHAAEDCVPWRGNWTPRGRLGLAEPQAAHAVAVIPTLHRRDLLALCLRALANGTAVPEQIVVVNNGDRPLELPERCGPARLETIEPGRNVGVAAAWNFGCQRAAGRPVILVNDDWQVGPTTVERLLAAPSDVCTVRTANERSSWSCVRLGAGVWPSVGPFDERFWPAMYEDYDYAERCGQRGLTQGVIVCRDSQHALHATRERLPAGSQELAARMDAAESVFTAKWGYPPAAARFKQTNEVIYGAR